MVNVSPDWQPTAIAADDVTMRERGHLQRYSRSPASIAALSFARSSPSTSDGQMRPVGRRALGSGASPHQEPPRSRKVSSRLPHAAHFIALVADGAGARFARPCFGWVTVVDRTLTA